MSLIEELGIPSRLVAYSVLQQLSSSAEGKEIPRMLGETFQSTLAAAASFRDAFSLAILESRMKTAQVAQGSLNTYLSTPIKSDNEDVQRIIREALEKYSEQVFPSLTVGIRTAWFSQVIADSSIVSARTKMSAVVRTMLSAGRHSLKESGFTKGKGLPNIFETNYLLEGGMNLDVLEACFRKSTSGAKDPQIAGTQSMELNNVLSISGMSDQTASLWEAAFYPPALEMNDEDLVREMDKIFTQLSKEFNLHQLSLWRKKFQSPIAQNHSVRIRLIPDPKLLLEIVKWYSFPGGEPFKNSFVDGAALVVKEILS